MKRPSFGDASQGSNARPLFCLQHKQPWHTDLVTKRCAAEDCGKRGTYSDRPLTRRLPRQHLHPRPCAPGGRAAPGTRTEKRGRRGAGGVGGGDDKTEDECDRRGEGGGGRGCGGGSHALDAVAVGRCVQQKVRETVAIESREKGGERGEQEGVEAGARGDAGQRSSQDGGEASADEASTSAPALGRGGGGRSLLFCAKHRVLSMFAASPYHALMFSSSACLPLPTPSSSVDLNLLLLPLSSSAPFFPHDPSTALCLFSLVLA
jgi:hypothetical protein